MSRIHLIEKHNRQVLIHDTETWESGYWVLGDEKASALIGGEIYFHKRQMEPSYMAGIITGFNRLGDGEFSGKIVFQFRTTDRLVGVITGKSGWGNEKKIVLSNQENNNNSKTAKTSKSMWGTLLYQQRAQLALSILVEWANRKDVLTYTQLADQLEMLHPRPTNKVLGCVGATLNELSTRLNIDIPPIQVLVINKNTKLPGAGVGWFISEEKYGDLSKEEKQNLVIQWHQKIYAFDRWGYVLEQLGLPSYDSSECFNSKLRIPVSKTTRVEGSSFLKWLKKNKSAKTAKNYHQAVGGTLSRLALKKGLIESNIFELKTNRSFDKLKTRLNELKEFHALNTRGKGMYAAALNALASFLNESFQSNIEEDLDELFGDDSLDVTTRSVLISTRIGQGRFRQKLVRYWGGCSVTGYPDITLLTASHIKPWQDSTNNERLSLFNGLLLTPNLDRAFDSGLVSFQRGGEILISRTFERPDMVGINETMSVKLDDAHSKYMSFHRDEIYRG